MVTQPVRIESRKANSSFMAENENVIMLPVITGEHTYIIIDRDQNSKKSQIMDRFRNFKEKLGAKKRTA